MQEKTVAILSILKEKNYKAKFLTSSILKSKIDKDSFGEKQKKKKQEEKKEKYCRKNKKKNKKVLQQSTATCEESYSIFPACFSFMYNKIEKTPQQSTIF